MRQNAIRKRLPETNIHLKRKSSTIQNNGELNEKLTLNLNDYQILSEKELPCDRVRKCSFDSINPVKKILNSFKGSNKGNNPHQRKRNSSEGDIRKQVILEGFTCEINNPNISSFIQSLGEQFGEKANEPVIQLESSWKELVNCKKIQTKNEENHQAAIWELIVTEVNLISQLGIVVTIFYPVLEELIKTYGKELGAVTINDVFGNVHELYRDHWTLWKTCISLPMVSAKINGNPLEIDAMKDGFVSISTILGCYSEFIRNLPKMDKLIKKLQNENFLFNEYIEWTESYSRQCREGLFCILSQPFQRITKYNLLLDRIRSLASNKSQSSIDDMMKSVESFVQKLNSSMNGKYSMQDLKERIVCTRITKEHLFDITKLVDETDLQFDITEPSLVFPERNLVHEGRLKLKEFGLKPVDVQLFLCNDLLMMCQPIKDNWNLLQLYKAPVRLDKLVVKTHLTGCLAVIVYNDFKMVDKVMELVGSCYEIKLWISNFNKAKTEFLSRLSDYHRSPIISDNNRYDGSVSMHCDEYSIFMSSVERPYSTTLSSVISTDSAFSNSPANLTPVESFDSRDTVMESRHFKDQNSKSMNNIDTITDSLQYEFTSSRKN